jgi:hypothetical protein
VVFEKIDRFFTFYIIFHFAEFYRTHYFKFVNFVVIKNLQMSSSFFNFIFKILKKLNLTDWF